MSQIEGSLIPLRTGVEYSLEEEADRLLAEGRRGVTRLEDKKDYLTRDQLMLRMSREVLNCHGIPDASLMSGMFRRAYNPRSADRPHRSHTME